MKIVEQLKHALIEAPLALRFLKTQSFSWMLIYALTGLALFSIFTWQLLSHEIAIKNLILDYLFPKSWHELSEQLLAYFYEAQAKVVIGNMILGASLVFASIFLFPIKEEYSARFEKDAAYPNGTSQEFPLLMQAFEESKLLLFYLTAQSVILWIGYYPYEWSQWLSIGLSYAFLFFTFGLDFISPTLQRHRIKYAVILKVLLKRPLLVMTYGALFSLPVVLLARWMFSVESLSLVEVASILFLINMLFLTLAVPTGTHIASQILPEVRQSVAPSGKTMTWVYSSMVLLLAFGLYLHGSLFKSLHHKSQLLKAHYSLDWGSFDYQLPSLDQFLNGKALTNLSFNLQITNPTEFDIVIENSQIFVEKLDKTIAKVDLSGFTVPAGETHSVVIKLDSLSDLGNISNFRTLLDDWRVDMHMEIWPGIPFIMNIYEQE